MRAHERAVKIAGLCKGSTADSDSVCEGSNPSPAASKENLGTVMVPRFFFIFKGLPMYRGVSQTKTNVLV